MIPLLIISKVSKLINDYVNKLKIGNLYYKIIPSSKEYSIEDIKNLKRETKIFNPKVRLYFLENFHLSSIPAQNSFLKLLEEPPSNVQFVLSTDNKNRLLSTIISRVKIVELRGESKQSGVDKFVIDAIEGVTLPAGRQVNHVSTGIPLTQFKITDKESAKNILLQLITFFRKKLDSDKKASIIIKETLYFNKLLENNNLNPQLTIDQALIFIWKQYKMEL